MDTIISKYRLYILLSGLCLLFIFIGGCEDKNAEADSASQSSFNSMSDKPLEEFQIRLLDTAFETATRIPIYPHIKDRSRSQEAVVETCLKLDQPKRALRYIEKIDNWRKHLCYANLACYCARHGHSDLANKYLDKAGQFPVVKQEWRLNRIKTKIIETRSLLGQKSMAENLKTELVNSETDEQAKAKVMAMQQTDSFEKRVESLDALIATDNFEMVKHALKEYVKLYDRFFDDEERRSQVEEIIMTSWDVTPIPIRIELLMELAGSAIAHSNPGKALEYLDEADILLEMIGLFPENYIEKKAKLAVLRFQAGDTEKAREKVNEALTFFNEQRRMIIDVYRAEALCPVAEAYHLMDDAEVALSVYKRAIDEGTKNPNSRPRAEDLSSTCCSMALHAAKPDDELWARIQQINEGLGDPW